MAGQVRKQTKKDPKTGKVKVYENTWTVRIFLGRESDGKRKYSTKTIHGTKKDADKYLTAKLREKDLGILIEPVTCSPKITPGGRQESIKMRKGDFCDEKGTYGRADRWDNAWI